MASYAILDALKSDHEMIRALQELLLDTPHDLTHRASLWLRLKSKLLAHAQAEEEAFYDRLTTFSETEHTAEHSIEEHDAIEELILQCDHIGFDQPQWLPTFERLVHVSNHHLDEEERELFPVAGRVLDDAMDREVHAEYRQRLAELERACMAGEDTTERGIRSGTLERRTVDRLRVLARSRDIEDVDEMRKSELISALRDAPEADV